MSRGDLLAGALREAALHIDLALTNLRRGIEASPVRPSPGVGSQREFYCAVAAIAVCLARFDLSLAREYAEAAAVST